MEALEERFALAKEAAQEAGRFLLSHEDLRSEIYIKGDNDYVTSADKASENIIRERIKSAFPEDAVLGEESGGARSGVRWIIDPIDGTVDFMTAFPNYTVSIGFEDEEGLAFGVVLCPRQGEMFSALRGSGAYLNGKRIHTDETLPLGESLAILVPPHRHKEILHSYMEVMERFYYLVSDVRALGTAALSLCYVASGRCDVYYERALHIYDVAAGIVILREAGGKVTFLTDDEDWLDIAASNSSGHERVLEVING